ncbi:MAG: hypothetical protein DRI89_01830 [Bacteroidetes bacterium]|nr:MAG: hypothetical protein DRI89_01830 [Bacteroidota bacterium]
MKTKKIFYTIISIVLLSILAIQIGCKKDDPEPVKKKYVWAVGDTDSTDYAQIYFSADGGENWTRQGEGQAAIKGIGIVDVWAVDENTVWAVAHQNVILKTTDGGTNWSRVTAPSQRSNVELLSISLIGKDDIWISGTVIYHSTDGGQNWAIIQSSILTNKFLQGIHAINSNVIYVAGAPTGTSDGFIAKTTDGGQTWKEIVPADNFNKNEWIGVTSSDLNNIVVYGGTSHYVYSNDGGQTWTNDSTRISGGNSNGGPDLNDLVMMDDQSWWGAFDNDNIGLTNNAGSSPWANQGNPTPGPGNIFLVGIDSYDNKFCVIVGESAGPTPYGKIIQTSNGGQLWKLGLATPSRMQKVSFIK